jgi:hypothetical protein
MIPMRVFNKIILGHNPLHVKRDAYSSTSKVACLLTCSRIAFHGKNPVHSNQKRKSNSFHQFSLVLQLVPTNLSKPT